MSNTVLPFGQLLRYLVECDDNERLLDSNFHTVIELLKQVPYYDRDDNMERVVLTYVYGNLKNFQRKKCFLVSFLERWLEMDCMTTAINGNMRKDNGNKSNVILPFLFEAIRNNTDLTFQNIQDLIPEKAASWVGDIHESNETMLLVLISTICCDKELIKCIPWLKGYFTADLLFKHTKYPCGKRQGTWLSVALAHYSHDEEENKKLTKTAKDLCDFLNFTLCTKKWPVVGAIVTSHINLIAILKTFIKSYHRATFFEIPTIEQRDRILIKLINLLIDHKYTNITIRTSVIFG